MPAVPPIRVIIPTFNNVDTLDATVESVLAQNYDQNKIFLAFVDFGSSDGTQEKILHYRKEQTGVFSLHSKRRGRTMIAQAAHILDWQTVGGREFLLWPGDILYPHCFLTAEKWKHLAARQKLSCQQLIAEVDVRHPDGSIDTQAPLFTAPCHLRAYSSDSYEYVKKGYRHIVLSYGGKFSRHMDKPSTQQNQRIWWNQLTYIGMVNDIVYINEVLGCYRLREYKDELDEILYRFETGLTCFRMAQEIPKGFVANTHFEVAFRFRLARYALWRAWLLYGKKQFKEAEDCFLLARVICPNIFTHPCWQKMEKILSGDLSVESWLSTYFNQEEAPDTPKWPISGFLPSLRRHWRLWRTNDTPSSWGKS